MIVYIEDKGGSTHEVETDLSIQDFLTETEANGYVTLKEKEVMMVDTINAFSDKPFVRN